MPPTERKGRVQTSTVTVAVFEILPEKQWKLKETDIEIFTTKDSGPGGQHRNKTESCVIIRHLPTGIEAKAATKSQHNNKKLARAVLESRVESFYRNRELAKTDADRKKKVGSGMRGDKIRTYREQDNLIIDHRTDKRGRLSDARSGKLDKIFQ